MKIVLAFDSFKGCMTQREACKAAEDAILSRYPGCEVVSIPMSDGGEGLSECIAAYYSSSPVSIRVHGPLSEYVECTYYISDGGDTAIMEMASAAGLGLVPEDRRNPLNTTTYGVGEMIADACDRGCHNIIMGIGGSATCDGGRGMVDCLRERLPLDVKITVACDVTNPLYGMNGAAYVFSPQKGANKEQVKILNDRLIEFANETVALGYALPEDAEFPGAGAAGGLGYALKTYLNAKLVSGAELMLDVAGFDEAAADADYIFTGEGKSDSQTSMGKVPFIVLERSKRLNKKVILLSGVTENKQDLLDCGYTIVNSINYQDVRPTCELMETSVAKDNLAKTILSTLSQL